MQSLKTSSASSTLSMSIPRSNSVPRSAATRDDVRLGGTAAHRRHGQVDAVGSGIECRPVLGDGDAGRLMGVHPQMDVLAESLPRLLTVS